jgi:hypothetical protein
VTTRIEEPILVALALLLAAVYVFFAYLRWWDYARLFALTTYLPESKAGRSPAPSSAEGRDLIRDLFRAVAVPNMRERSEVIRFIERPLIVRLQRVLPVFAVVLAALSISPWWVGVGAAGLILGSWHFAFRIWGWRLFHRACVHPPESGLWHRAFATDRDTRRGEQRGTDSQ